MTNLTPVRAGAHAVRIAITATPRREARGKSLAHELPALIGSGAVAEWHTLQDAQTSAIQGSTALVVLLDARDIPTGLSALLDAAEEARLAVLLLIDDGGRRRASTETAAVESIDADDATIAAVLRGMIGRQPEIDRLGRELAIATRFTGGLRGEISRMQEELQLAAQVQREFLPRTFPEVGDLRADAFWRPASYVSGDIYDVVRLDERHIGVFIADAVGHGIPAALLTMVICRGLPSKEVGNGTYRIIPPGEALARINRDMITHQGRTTRFATAVYCVIDTSTGHAAMAGAGHPPPVILRANGETELVESDGGLLGVFEGESYREVQFQLLPGDRLLIYSDGFEQAFPGDPSGTRQARLPSKRYLDEFVAVRAAPTAAALVQQIARRVDMQFGSVRQADDLTLLVIERLREGTHSA
ncbi:MAG: PP2C family protein-serine/threonine phosphatase [Planctomycetota bacterium]|nr:PP2C family protein-serine/threonine phosphatase [Planctomycetota bacterium]